MKSRFSLETKKVGPPICFDFGARRMAFAALAGSVRRLYSVRVTFTKVLNVITVNIIIARSFES